MKISGRRISNPLKEYNMIKEDLLQKFKKSPVLENPLLYFIWSTDENHTIIPTGTEKALGEKISENNPLKKHSIK